MAITRQEANRARSKLKVKEMAEIESCSVEWTIPNWKEVRMDEAALNSQKVTLELSQYGKWVIGLKVDTLFDGLELLRVYWKLVEIYGNFKQLDVTVCFGVLDYLGGEVGSDKIKKVVSLNEIIESYEGYLQILTTSDEDDPYIHSDGSVKYSLKLLTKLPLASNKRQLLTKEFSRKSFKKMCENQGSILTNDANTDLKIVARDGTEIRAHKAILMAQCPVFGGMLGNQFRETTSGVIHLDDISGKTMKILLHYFYTGSLLPTWSDEDTILEFVYAAGKYQMNLVLELLDNTLGMDHQRETCYVDVQLLNLADKLSLKRAECRLLKRLKKKIENVKESKDLFDLFGYDNEGVARMADLMDSEIIGNSNVFEIMDTLLRDQESNEQKKDLGKQGLQVLAVLKRKNENGKVEKLEKLLLDRFGEIVAKIKSATELFNFSGYENL